QKLNEIFRGKKEREDILTEIEELLIAADFGIEFTFEIIGDLKKSSPSLLREKIISSLKNIIKEKMTLDHRPESHETLNAHLIFGVNGTGKTTTVGKLAYRLKVKGKRVLIAAADTYRDAAIDQLVVWSKRANVPLIRQEQGADPGAVVYDACDAARSRHVNDLVIDTAGRLHNKEALMEELAKISRVLEKKLPEANIINLLTLDATTGQNAISQAFLFNKYIGVDGIILTKLDSSAKGGIACAVSGKLKIPLLYAGTGEKVEDLIDFDLNEYLNNIFA
ncbi:MAG: signal recognition particle-docking protein FtsY, partial [Spirochaetes bacterium]|nr:signal recognition particle-docking protein FtsY [Spirochaetota bacterium]